jgi:hypothetical protein
MAEEDEDQLPPWGLCRSAHTPRRELMPLLRKLGLPVTGDVETGGLHRSRSAIRSFLLEVVE